MRANIQTYAGTISKLTEILEQTGDQVDPYFQELKKWMQLGQVADLYQAKLAEIKNQFQLATDNYRSIEKELTEMQAPIKFIGKHQNLKHDYLRYIEECQKMVDTINPEAKKVNAEDFNASEKAQAEIMGQITKTLTRIMNMLLA